MTAYFVTDCPYANRGPCGHSWETEEEIEGKIYRVTHYCMWNRHIRFDKHDCGCGEAD